MWSFIASALAFVVLVCVLGFWQRHMRKRGRNGVYEVDVDQEIQRSAEIAQRLHLRRFGKEDTGLHQAFNASLKASK